MDLLAKLTSELARNHPGIVEGSSPNLAAVQFRKAGLDEADADALVVSAAARATMADEDLLAAGRQAEEMIPDGNNLLARLTRELHLAEVFSPGPAREQLLRKAGFSEADCAALVLAAAARATMTDSALRRVRRNVEPMLEISNPLPPKQPRREPTPEPVRKRREPTARDRAIGKLRGAGVSTSAILRMDEREMAERVAEL